MFLEGVATADVVSICAADMLLAPYRFLHLASPFCIALNRSRGRRQEGVEPLPYDGVALARCLFEAGTIENLNLSPTIADKAGRLHRLRCKRHRFAIGTQHVRQELVRVWQGFAFGPIMHHEEPSAHSLFRRMHGIARDSLLNLRQQRLRIADEEIAHVFAALEFRLQQFDRAANHAALQLHKTSIEGDAAVHGREEAECSFAPDVCGLNCRAVLQNGQQREDGALREIGVLEEAARLADDGTKLELDRLKMRVDPLAAGSLQGAEQPIAPRIISLTLAIAV